MLEPSVLTEQANPENSRYDYRELGVFHLADYEYNSFLGGGHIGFRENKLNAKPKPKDRITLIYKSKRNEENRITAVFSHCSNNSEVFFFKSLEYDENVEIIHNIGMDFINKIKEMQINFSDVVKLKERSLSHAEKALALAEEAAKTLNEKLDD